MPGSQWREHCAEIAESRKEIAVLRARLDRLTSARRARDLLAARFDTTRARLALYSGEGFSTDDSDITRIGLSDFYHQQGPA